MVTPLLSIKKMVSPLLKNNNNNIKKFVTIFSGNCSITKQEKKYQKLNGTSALKLTHILCTGIEKLEE